MLKHIKGALKAFNKSVKDRGGYREMAKNFGRSFKPGGALNAFDMAEGGVKYNVRKDIGVKLLAGTPKAAVSFADAAIGFGGSVGRRIHKMGRPVLAAARTPVGKTATRGMFVAGATAMLGLHTMKGGMNEARDIAHERYMQDYTYSTSVLQNSRVGSTKTSALSARLNTGLVGAMHKTRHGR